MTNTRKGRLRNNKLAHEIGQRISEAMGDKSIPEFAIMLNKAPITVWSYVNGVIMPSVEVLKEISTLTGKSIDWLVNGDRRTVDKKYRKKRQGNGKSSNVL